MFFIFVKLAWIIFSLIIITYYENPTCLESLQTCFLPFTRYFNRVFSLHKYEESQKYFSAQLHTSIQNSKFQPKRNQMTQNAQHDIKFTFSKYAWRMEVNLFPNLPQFFSSGKCSRIERFTFLFNTLIERRSLSFFSHARFCFIFLFSFHITLGGFHFSVIWAITFSLLFPCKQGGISILCK